MVVTCQLHGLPPDSIRLVGKSGARFYPLSYMVVTWQLHALPPNSIRLVGKVVAISPRSVTCQLHGKLGFKPSKGCNYVGYSPLHSVLLSVLPLASL